MARTVTRLTDRKIKNSKPKDKEYRLFDGGGLYLSIPPKGNKRWRLKYRFNNKEKLISLGIYPNITLAKAREIREELKQLIANGIDPSEEKKSKKQKAKEIERKKQNTFYNISQKWLAIYKDDVSENHFRRVEAYFNNYLYRAYNNINLKNKPIDEITRADIATVLEIIKDKASSEVARRLKQKLNRIFMYAVTHEYAPHNIIADIDIKALLGKRKKNKYPTFTKKKDIKGLLLAIEEYQGSYHTRMALKVLPYLFVRSSNIRKMEWKEIDFKAKEWVIPANKMKMKREFILPLPQQVIILLQELKENSLSSKYVFPSLIHKDRPLSDNTLITALRRMGYTKDEFVPHSFRAMFSTIANEHGKPRNVIEALLAHKNTNEVESAYNRAEYKEQKKDLIQWYANYLDEVKNG